jgi:glycosyltransferase involved in cell wall biosynthesis
VKSSKDGGTITSIGNFLRFQIKVFGALLRYRPERYYVYDLYSCLAVLLPSKFLSRKKHKLWYHSHDVINPAKGYNLSNLAKWAEKKVLQKCYGFSSPSVQRISHYPVPEVAESKHIEIRNYPSLDIFKFGKPRSIEGNTVKLVFSGAISVNRGIMELVEALTSPIEGKQVELHLFTYPSPFTAELMDKVDHLNISDRVHFHKPLSYRQLAKKLPEFDIGIAFYNGSGILETSSATGSNKLYEYGASGLPVMFLDKVNFREVLSDLKPWLEFVKLNPKSIQYGIGQVINYYH